MNFAYSELWIFWIISGSHLQPEMAIMNFGSKPIFSKCVCSLKNYEHLKNTNMSVGVGSKNTNVGVFVSGVADDGL